MKFKLKDRVAVYTMNGAIPVRKIGFINVLNPEGLMHEIQLDNGNWIYASKQQLRRLKPKQKPVAREIYINEYNGRLNDVWHDDVKRADALGCGRDRRVTFREVLQNPTSNEVGG